MEQTYFESRKVVYCFSAAAQLLQSGLYNHQRETYRRKFAKNSSYGTEEKTANFTTQA